MKDVYLLLQQKESDPKLVFDSKIFSFPFTQIKLSINTLK